MPTVIFRSCSNRLFKCFRCPHLEPIHTLPVIAAQDPWDNNRKLDIEASVTGTRALMPSLNTGIVCSCEVHVISDGIPKGSCMRG